MNADEFDTGRAAARAAVAKRQRPARFLRAEKARLLGTIRENIAADKPPSFTDGYFVEIGCEASRLGVTI